MMQAQPLIKYFAYLRKSTEEEERQVLSIITQKEKIAEEFGDFDIEFIEETRSAFLPYNRSAFADMIDRMKRGDRRGLVAWHPDRLSRNEIDAATVTYMIRTGQILDLKFGSYYFDNSPEGIWMLQMALSQSQYSSAKLSKDVKRGMEKKVSMGWRPGVAPLGYLNDKESTKGEKKILVDPESFPLLRKIIDLMLTGSHTPPQILKIATREWGFRTRKSKRRAGGEWSMSGIYKFLTNPFYAGLFKYNGVLYPGKHQPMMTLAEFDKIQELLGRKGKTRPKKHEFAFTGLIRCGECGCLVTAETKNKLLKNGGISEHTYYHCTRKKKDIQCSQRKNIPVANLEFQIEQELEKYTILPEFRDWALEVLNRRNNAEIETRKRIYEAQHKALVQTQTELDNLTKMRYRDLIDDEAFLREKDLLQGKIVRLKEELRGTEQRAETWLELTEKTFNFATYARKEFLLGDLKKKREILMALGSNLTLKDGKLFIQANEWLQPIKEKYPALEAEYLKLEPTKRRMNKAKREGLASLRARWSGVVEDVRTRIGEARCQGGIPDSLKVA
jgi:DNA invertase Pin-like site-specific DNA recombinase